MDQENVCHRSAEVAPHPISVPQCVKCVSYQKHPSQVPACRSSRKLKKRAAWSAQPERERPRYRSINERRQCLLHKCGQTQGKNKAHPSETAPELLLPYDNELITENQDDFIEAGLADGCARLDHAHQMRNLVLGTITTRSSS